MHQPQSLAPHACAHYGALEIHGVFVISTLRCAAHSFDSLCSGGSCSRRRRWCWIGSSAGLAAALLAALLTFFVALPHMVQAQMNGVAFTVQSLNMTSAGAPLGERGGSIDSMVISTVMRIDGLTFPGGVSSVTMTCECRRGQDADTKPICGTDLTVPSTACTIGSGRHCICDSAPQAFIFSDSSTRCSRRASSSGVGRRGCA